MRLDGAEFQELNLSAAHGVAIREVPVKSGLCDYQRSQLAAISLQTGRGKDKARLLQFVEAGTLDGGRFQAIIDHHGVVEK